jgi:hypothetical protein
MFKKVNFSLFFSQKVFPKEEILLFCESRANSMKRNKKQQE